MALILDVSDPEDLGDIRASKVAVRVTDEDHQLRTAVFDYLAWLAVGEGPQVMLVGISVGPAPETAPKNWPRLTPTQIRDLPIARWETAARQSLIVTIDDWIANAKEAVGKIAANIGQRKRSAEELVLEHYPETATLPGAAGERRRKSLLRLAETSIAYRELLREGRGDPAAEIARRQNIPPATARSLIYRARQAGFLGAAVGRTPGEDQEEASE